MAAQLRRRGAIPLAAWLLCLCGTAWPGEADRRPARVVYQTSSPYYDNILVIDEDGLRSLRFNSATDVRQSLVRPGHPEQLPMPYLRSAAVGLVVPDNLRRMLVIGLGGGAFPNFVRTRLPDVVIDAVEIDPVVVAIAREYFAVREGAKLRLHVMDAVAYVKQGHAPYDFILLDAYGAGELPEALVSSEFLSNVRASLASGGVVVANVAIPGTRKARAVIRKLADPFHYCLQLRSPPRFNDVLLLALQPLPSPADLIGLARRFDADSEAELALEKHAATARPCFGPGR